MSDQPRVRQRDRLRAGPDERECIRIAVPHLDDHPSSYVVRDLIHGLVGVGLKPVRIPRHVGAALARAGVRPPRTSKALIVVPMMGPRFDVLHAACLFGTPVPYCWDVWEPRWDDWVNTLTRLRPPLVMTTALQSAEYLQGRLPGIRVEHLPEAADLQRYLPGAELHSRGIDVLELGRRNNAWHAAVVGETERRRLRHLYEPWPGKLVFPGGEDEMLRGLADSKVSVCFPSSITHPLRAGSVTTMTHRYLESIASRSVVLGHGTEELTALLGCDPVVPADPVDPWGQLSSVLDSISHYQERVDDARTRLLAVGGWNTRVSQLAALVRGL
jgi:hypothetical protein